MKKTLILIVIAAASSSAASERARYDFNAGWQVQVATAARGKA